MFIPTFSLITVNGKFISNSDERIKNKELWYAENLNRLITYTDRKSNFIYFKEIGFSVMLYTKASFKIMITDVKKSFQLEEIIDNIRKNIASKLYDQDLISSSYTVTQIVLSVRPPFEKPMLNFERIFQLYSEEFSISDILFSFQIDHFAHESGSSHFYFKMYSNNESIGTCNIYNNYKTVIFLKNASMLKNCFNAVSEFLKELQLKCVPFSP